MGFCKDCRWFIGKDWCSKLSEKTSPNDHWICFESDSKPSLKISTENTFKDLPKVCTHVFRAFFGRDKDGTLWMFKSKPNKGTEGYSVQNIEEMVDVSKIISLPEVTWNDKSAKEFTITVNIR